MSAKYGTGGVIPHLFCTEYPIAEPLDAHYYLGQGARGGERANLCCFRKTAHPRNAAEGQGWEETALSDTLNVFDNSETRTPMLVAYALYERAGCAGGGKGALVQTDKVGTLKPDNYQVIFQPVISIDRAGFNQGVNAKYDIEISDNGITPPSSQEERVQ